MARFNLKTSRTTKDGRAAVMLSGHIAGVRVRLGTSVSVKPSDWDHGRQKVRRTDPRYAELNAILAERLAEFEREVASRRLLEGDLDIDRLRSDLSKKKRANTDSMRSTFWETFEGFMAANMSSNEWSEGTVKRYRVIESVLREIEIRIGTLTFEKIDRSFEELLKDHAFNTRGVVNSTAEKYIKCLKCFLTWAEERGAPVNSAYRKFALRVQEPVIIALTGEELRKIEQMDLTTEPRLDRVRDLFLFACYTGVRHSDLRSCTLDDVKDGVWCFYMKKTRDLIQIDLIPKALAILGKYTKSNRSLPPISNQKMNDYLREVGKQAGIDTPTKVVRFQGSAAIETSGPKWQFMSTKMARKTFVSLSLERGMRPEVVMSYTGHKDYDTMKKYLALHDPSRRRELMKAWESEE